MSIRDWFRPKPAGSTGAEGAAAGALAAVEEAPKPTADVALFALHRVHAAKGHASELGWIYSAYVLYAREGGKEPLDRSAFDRAWAVIAKEAGIKQRPHNGQVIVEGVKLSA